MLSTAREFLTVKIIRNRISTSNDFQLDLHCLNTVWYRRKCRAELNDFWYSHALLSSRVFLSFVFSFQIVGSTVVTLSIKLNILNQISPSVQLYFTNLFQMVLGD